jgi:hypothetical protein
VKRKYPFTTTIRIIATRTTRILSRLKPDMMLPGVSFRSIQGKPEPTLYFIRYPGYLSRGHSRDLRDRS